MIMNKEFMAHSAKRCFVLALVAVLLISSLSIPTPVQAAEEDGFGNRTIMVSLGDSYSSGEGIEPFYDQSLAVSEKVQSQDWLAHRSKNSWSGMLTLPGVHGTMAQNKDSVWYFVASSGARTKHLNNKQDDEGKYYSKDDGWWNKYEGQGVIDPQLDVFKSLPEDETDYVTMTMGGNDADFTGIITKAAVSTAYFNISGLKDQLNSKLEQLEENGELRKNLLKAYQDVAEAAGPQADIIVAGYPCLLDCSGKGALFTRYEAELINSAVSKFNDAIEGFIGICRGEGMNIYFVSVEEAFAGHEAYSSDPYINKVILGQQDEDLKDHDLFGASAYSIHPNYKGACVYAQCVQAKINQLENLKTIYKTSFALTVYDYRGQLCSGYTVKIDGTSKPFIWGLFEKEYSDTFTVTDAAPTTINLPKGEYTITVTDGEHTYSSQITVKNSGKKEKMVVNTSLGYDPTWGGEVEDWYDEPVRTTSDERDVVLVLDVSGSMSGEPMEETKKAAHNFIETVLQQDASIGIVTYDSSAYQAADFSVDAQYLNYCVDNIYANGGTNIDSGIAKAYEMLENSTAKKKIIVLMSDGEPTHGRNGQDLIDFSDEIKNDGIVIYTLGFFENLGSYKSSAQALMEGIASDGCHYEVANADDLVFFFEDMADQISGMKYIYIRIACPVDVTVTYNGETLSSAGDTLNQRTNFGTLTFEAGENSHTGADDWIKILRLKEGEDYDVRIVGTGRGLMDYTIGFMDENGKYSDLREFQDVKITKKTVIDTVAAVSRSTVLNVDQDGDGKYDIRYRAEENGYGEEIKFNGVVCVFIAAALVAVAVGVYAARKKNKRKKEKEGM